MLSRASIGANASHRSILVTHFSTVMTSGGCA